MKRWEIIADSLKKAGWSLSWVSALNVEGRTIWIADPHRGDGKRFVVRAEQKLTGFVELEAATQRVAVWDPRRGKNAHLVASRKSHYGTSNLRLVHLLRSIPPPEYIPFRE